MKLWLDDTRSAPDDSWTVARTADEAIALMHEVRDTWIDKRGFEAASLDHDLGHCADCEGCKGYGSKCGCRCHLTGNFVVNWMATENVWPERLEIHSMNPVGAENMRATALRYGPYERVPWVPAPKVGGR